MVASFFPLPAFLILILSITHFNFYISARKTLSSDTNSEFIKTCCGSTTYPDLCLTTFSSYASEIQSSPKNLAGKSLFLALNTTRAASMFLKKLKKRPDLKTREAAAVKDCAEQVDDSVDELKRSIGELDESEGKSFDFRMNDIETWVSAALTNDDSCMDGFSEGVTDGDVKEIVKKQIEKVAHLTSIALAFVNRYAHAGTRN